MEQDTEAVFLKCNKGLVNKLKMQTRELYYPHLAKMNKLQKKTH